MARVCPFSLYLITDRNLCGGWDPLLTALERALAGGADAVQLREKDLSAGELYPRARQVRELTRRFGARLLINDRADVALAVEADGVHLGGHSLPAAVVRERLGAELLVGVSTHSVAEVATAAAGGADFVTFGPVYATPSKAAYGLPLGVTTLGDACRAASLPVYALGGVTPERRAEVLAAGAAGCAVIAAVLGAVDPGRAAASFL
ncbi:MAG: thiamine phosphate synthase [Deferrisomatales bacterium]|nr:thiamine phosphate synthase [Deferrisomatales bacterium]